MRKIYGTLTVKVVIDLDDTYSDETIACLDFLDGFELIPAEGAIVIDSDITDFEITDSK